MKNTLKNKLYTMTATAGFLSLTLAGSAVPASAAIPITTNSNFDNLTEYVVDYQSEEEYKPILFLLDEEHKQLCGQDVLRSEPISPWIITCAFPPVPEYKQFNILGGDINLRETENTNVSDPAIDTLKTDLKNLLEK